MLDFLNGIDGEGRFWLCLWGMTSAVAVCVVAGVTTYCTVTEVNNPNPNKWQRYTTEPTVRAKLVPAGE